MKPASPPNFILTNKIGEGAFAQVWLSKHISSNINVAIKIISKNTIRSKDQKTRMIREYNLQKLSAHPFLASVYSMLENPLNYYLVMEYIPCGTLGQKVHECGFITEKKARHYFIQISLAVQYLHNVLHIAHRDLKTENIMIDDDDNIRIIDFGFSNQFDDISDDTLKTKCGSPRFAAPELYNRTSYTKAVDIWSIGVLLFYITTGVFPYDGETKIDVIRNIEKRDPEYPVFLTDSLIDLLQNILVKDPTKRYSINQILEHPWIKKGNEFTPPLINFNENDSMEIRMLKREEISKIIKDCVLKTNETVIVKTLSNPSFSETKKEMKAIDKLCATGKFKQKAKIPQSHSLFKSKDLVIRRISSNDYNHY